MLDRDATPIFADDKPSPETEPAVRAREKYSKSFFQVEAGADTKPSNVLKCLQWINARECSKWRDLGRTLLN